MIQSGWVCSQNGRKLWSRGGLKYRFIVSFPYFSLVFVIFRYLKYRLWYRYFEIPLHSVSVTDPGLIQMLLNCVRRLFRRMLTYHPVTPISNCLGQGCTTSLRPRTENSMPAGPRTGGEVLGGAASTPLHQLLGVCGSAVSSLATNAIWCRIASGGTFFNYLFQLKKWKWCTLMLECGNWCA